MYMPPPGFAKRAPPLAKTLLKGPKQQQRTKKKHNAVLSICGPPAAAAVPHARMIELRNVGVGKTLAAQGDNVRVVAGSEASPSGKKWKLVPVSGEANTFYVVGQSKFLDTHGQGCWLWGDGEDVGSYPSKKRPHPWPAVALLHNRELTTEHFFAACPRRTNPVEARANRRGIHDLLPHQRGLLQVPRSARRERARDGTCSATSKSHVDARSGHDLTLSSMARMSCTASQRHR